MKKLLNAAFAVTTVIVVIPVTMILKNSMSEKSGTKTGNAASSIVDSSNTSNSSSTISELASEGKDMQCDVTVEGQSAKAYFSQKRVRFSFTSTNSVRGNMIINGNTQYVWADGKTQGAKFTYNESSASSSSSSSAPSTRTNYVFTCRGWKVDAAQFQPPANVTFSELSSSR